MRIALAGNPNSGKTTTFNALTGRNEKVGNWAGVTVDKKEHLIKKTLTNGEEYWLVDLPGAYSMSPFTNEESITSSYIKEEKPDVIINVVDSTNLGRNLFFTTQLLELGIPVVVALNKADLNKKKRITIDNKQLSKLFNCPVIDTVSTSNKGLKRLIEKAVSVADSRQLAPYVEDSVDYTDREQVLIEDKKRFEFVKEIVKQVENRKEESNNQNKQDKVDAILTNKWVGLPIFALIMFLLFGISQAWVGQPLADLFTGLLESGQDAIRNLLMQETGTLGVWSTILVEGVLGGVIAVVSFLPLIMIMYFLIALLEDCGYFARASVVLDPIFKKVGLNGKSVISFVIGVGCSVPGIMATRTIKNERERRATALLTPFMPCGAKLPVIALFSSIFFKNSTWIGVIIYFVGIFIILICALIIKALTGVKNKKSYFIIELPEYKLPNLLSATKSMLSRGWSYVVKAGTIILICNLMICLMQSFNWAFQPVDANSSILKDVATPFAYLISPIVGKVGWQFAASSITGFIAKENIIGTLASSFGGYDFGISAVAGLAYLVFNLFSPPCFAAIGAMKAEMKSAKWFWAGLGLQFGVGYTIGFLTYFIGTLITGAQMVAWMVIVGFLLTLAFLLTISILIIKRNIKDKQK